MSKDINLEYITQFLNEILEIPSPSGFCNYIMQVIKEKTSDLGYDFELTNKGCGVITVPGENDNMTVGLSAHVDTLGAMVRSIKDNGYIRLTPIGGYMMSTIEGEYCKIHTRDNNSYNGTVLTTQPSVHVYDDAYTLKREQQNMEVRLDEVVSCKEDVKKLGIDVGDYISFDPRTQILNSGFIKSRHLDDKAGVSIIFGVLEYLKRNNITPKYNLKIFISVYEEVGHGSSFIPEDIDELLAVDMGAIGEDLQCTEQQVSICAKDSSGPYDYNIVSKLVNESKENNIDYVVDIYPSYSSDVSAALRAGSNIRGALIGPGVHASHGMERTHINGIKNSVKLLINYLTR